jgi:hypothetical protein
MQDEPMEVEEVLQSLSEMVAVVMITETRGDVDELKEMILGFGNMLVASLATGLINPEGQTLN